MPAISGHTIISSRKPLRGFDITGGVLVAQRTGQASTGFSGAGK